MKKFSSLFLAGLLAGLLGVWGGADLRAQVNFCATPPACSPALNPTAAVTPASPVCAGTSLNLNGNFTAPVCNAAGYTGLNPAGGPYRGWTAATAALYPLVAPISPGGLTCDDCNAGPFPIGFNFQYACQTVTQFWINSNGVVSFAAPAAGFIVNAIPNAGNPNHWVGIWMDLDNSGFSGASGQIRYEIQGTAPCRRLVIEYRNIPFFFGVAPTATFQVILHETSNHMEIQIQNVTQAATKTFGTENVAGNGGYSIAGRNGANWSTVNEGWVLRPVASAFQTEWQNSVTGFISNSQITTHTPPAGNSTYTFFAYDAAVGCTTALSFPYTAANPPLPLGTLTGPTDACQLTTQTYSTAVPPPAGVTYNWTILPAAAGNIVSGQGTASVNVQWLTTGTHTLTLNATNAPCPAQTASVSVNVGTPVTNPGAVNGPATACPGVNTVYSVAIPPTGSVVYTWQFIPAIAGNIVSGQGTQNVTVTWNTAGILRLTASSLGCPPSFVNDISVTVPAPPVQPPSIVGNAVICQGAIENYSVSPSPGVTYQWSVTPAGPVLTPQNGPTFDRVSVNWNSAGTYTLTVTPVSGACTGTPRTLTVTVNPFPAQPGAINGPVNLCERQTGNYSITPAANANSYLWTVTPNVGVIINGQGTINTNIFFLNPGFYTLTVNGVNGCGNGPTQTLFVTVTGFPARPNVQVNTSPVCPGLAGAEYRVEDVPGTVYNWVLPPFASLIAGAGSNQIFVNWAANTPPSVYILSVTPVLNGCIGTTANLPVFVSPPPPPQPGTITGPANVCPNQTGNYSVAAVPTATSYLWSGLPAGATFTAGQGTRTATVNWGSAAPGTYLVTVEPINSCGTGPAQSFVVMVPAVPPAPGTITPPVLHCLNTLGTYAAPPSPGATSYTWTNSCGWQGTSTTNSIDFLATNVGPCMITVRANGACGSSPVTSLNVNAFTPPAQPSIINGRTIVCRNTNEVYSVTDVPGTNYVWSGLPGGASITAGQGTSDVAINWGTANPGIYFLTVTPSNGCGAGQDRRLVITVRDVPAQPGPINGVALLCQNTSALYNVTPVAGVTYAWSVNPTGPVLAPNASQVNVTWVTAGSFTLTLTAINTCGESVVRSFNVTVSPALTADGGPDQTVCGPAALFFGSPTGGTWACTFCPGGATLTQFGDLAFVNNLSPDAVTVLSYTVNDPLCGPSTDFVSVRNDEVNPGLVANGSTVCAGSTGVLTLTGFTPTATILRWESSTDNFASNINVINNTVPTYTYSNLTQTTQYRAVLQLSGFCLERNSGITTVTVVPDNVAQAAPSLQTVCADNATVTATMPVSGTGQWVFIDGPAPAAVATNLGTGLISGLTRPGDYVFQWRITNAPCPPRFVNVTVRKIAGVVIANAGPNQQICADNTTLNGNNPGNGSGVWSFVSGPTTANVVTAGVTGLVTGMTLPGTYAFRWTITDPNCAQISSADVAITVNGLPTPAFAGADQDVCGTSATVSGNIPVNGTPEWRFVSGPSLPNILQGGNTATVVNLTLPGTYLFEYVITVPGCPASVSQVRINKFSENEPAQVVNTVWNTCANDFSVQAVAPLQGTGTWSFVSGPATAAIFTSGTVGNIVGMTAPGEYVFRWSVGSVVCGLNSILVSVFKYDGIFPAAFAGANQQLCNISSALLSGSAVPAGARGTWRFVSGPVVASLNQFGNFAGVVNMSVPGDYVFSWTVENPGCPPSVSTVTITRVANPTPAQASPSGTICGTSASLRGNTPLVGTGSWAILSSPGGNPQLISNAEAADISNMTVPGVYVIRYTIANPPCAPSFSDVFLTVNPMSDPGTLTTNVLTACASGNSGTLTLTGNMGTIVRWERSNNDFLSINIIPVSTSTLAFANLTESTSYRAIVKQGTCPEAVSNVIKIDITPIPNIANAGPDQQICGNGTILRGNSPGPGAVGTWLFIGSSNGQTPNVTQTGNDAVIAGMTLPGDFFFQYFTINACGLFIDDVTVTVNTGTNAGFLVGDATVCSGSNSGSIDIIAFNGNVIRWEISTDNFLTFRAVPNFTSTQTYSNLTRTTSYRAIVKDGICAETATNIVNINVVQPVTAFAGFPQTLCSDRVTLNGNNPGPDGTPSWSQVSGSPAVLTSFGTRADASSLTPGTYVFRYTIDFGGACPASVSDVTITVNAPTQPGQVSMNTSICSGGSATLNLIGYTGNILRWERSTNEWLTVLTIANTTPVQTVNNLTRTTAYRAVVQVPGCSAETSLDATVRVFEPGPAADAGADRVICENSITLKGNAPGTGIPSWSYVSGPSVPIIEANNENALVLNLGVGTTVLQYQIDRGPCGITTDQIAVTVDAPANPGFLTGGATVCNTGSGTLTLTAFTGNVVRWEQSTDNFITVQPIVNNTPTLNYTNLTRTTAYRAVVGGNTCGERVSNAVSVVVENGNYVANAGLDRILCGTGVTLTGNMPNMMVGSWSVVSFQPGSNPQILANLNEANITGLTVSGTYVFRYTLATVSCPASSDDVTVTITAPSVAGTLIPTPAAVCAGTNSGTVTLSGNVGNVVRWEFSTDNFITFTTVSNTNSTFNFTNLTRTTAYRTVVQSGSCASVISAPVTVNVDPATVGGEVLTNQTVCLGVNSGILTLSGFWGSVVRWENSTDGVNWLPIVNTAPSYSFTNLAQTTFFRAVVQSGACPAQNSGQVRVTVAPPPVAGTLSADNTICRFTGSGTLTLTGQVGQVTRWESAADAAFLTGITVINNTTATLNYSGLGQTTYYRAVVGAPNCATVNTNVIAVTVVSPPAGGSVSANATVCAQANGGALTLTGAGGNVVRWESSTDCINFNTTIANFSNVLFYSNLTQTICYRAVVSNNFCTPVPSEPARITVTPQTVGGTVQGGTSVCLGQNGGSVTLSGQTGTILNWEQSTDCFGFTNPTTLFNNTNVQIYANLTQTTCFRAIVQNAPCSALASGFATVTVVSTPEPGFILGNVPGCAGQASGILTLVSNTAPVIRWESSTDNFNFFPALITTSSNFTYSNLFQTTYYRAVVQLSNCPPVVSPSVAVLVSPAPVPGFIQGGNVTVCNGVNSGTLTVVGNTGSVTNWERSEDGGLTWVNTFISGNNFTYSALTRTTLYRASVVSSPCEPVRTASVLVNVLPVLNVSASSFTGCGGTGSVIGSASGGSGGGYVYTLLPTGITNNTGQFPNLPVGSYTLQVRDGNNCLATANVTVSAQPSPPVMTATTNITSSSGVVNWVNAGAGVTYNLRFRLLGETTWTVITGLNTNSRLLTALQNNSTYEIEVQYICPSGFTSAFSTGLVRQFTTLPMGTGDCANSNVSNVPIPGGIYLSQVTATTARVHWNLVNNAQGYIVSYGLVQDNPANWVQFIVCHPTTSFLITNLQPNAQYRVRLRTNCSNCFTALNNFDVRSVWSAQYGFNTPAIRGEETVNLNDATDVRAVIYPNPTKGSFMLALSRAATGTAEIFDLTGRRVAFSSVTEIETPMNLEGMAAGIYTLRLQIGDEVKTMKVVLE